MSAWDHDDAIRTMIRLGTLGGIDDSGAQQVVKTARGLPGEELSGCYRVQGHGLSSVPPEGSVGMLLSMGGLPDRTLMLGFEHEDYRPRDQKAGWTSLYDANDNVVSLVGPGGIRVRSKGSNIAIDVQPGQKVFLGGDGSSGSYHRVMTESGISMNLWARTG